MPVWFASTRFKDRAASGLLSSTAMWAFSMPRIFMTMRSPETTSPGYSRHSRSSAVMKGSHSLTLTMMVSTLPMAEDSFTWVGKVAPPMPTTPPSRMMSISSWGLKPSTCSWVLG